MLSFSLCFEKVSAAFDLESTAASYDSNTGWLIIYDDEFTDENSDYTQKFKSVLSKVKLGKVALQGSSYFKDGFVRIILTKLCKEEVNQQDDFIQTHSVSKQLTLERGAFVKTYTPPGGINVVVDSYSNKTVLNVNVKGIKPKMKVDSFTASQSIINNTGGNVIFYVNGNNLDLSSFSIKNENSHKVYNLEVFKTKASVNIKISENKTNKNRIDTFVLYINNVESGKKLNITILPLNEQSNNADQSHESNDIPSNDNNNLIIDNNSNNRVHNDQNKNNVTDKRSEDTSSNTQGKDILKEESNIKEDEKAKSDTQLLSHNSKTKENKSDSFIYIISGGLLVLIIILSQVLYGKYK